MRNQTRALTLTTCRRLGVRGVLAAGALTVGSAFAGALGLAASPSGATTTFPNGGGFNSVSCWSAQNCMAVGQNGFTASSDNAIASDGGNWVAGQTIASPANLELTGVSCPAANTCFALGAVSSFYAYAFETTNGGASWSQLGDSGLPDGQTLDIDCPSSSVCYATEEQAILLTINAGATWTAVNSWLASGDFGLMPEITCWSTTSCLMGGPILGPDGQNGAYVFSTTNSGTSWTSASAPGGMSNLYTLSCWSANACEAGGTNGSTGVVASTNNGGASWDSLGVGGTSSIGALSCDTQICGGIGAGSPAVVVSGAPGGGLSVMGTAAGPMLGITEGTAASCSGGTCALVGWSTGSPPHPVATSTAVTAPTGHGYWLVGSDGGVFSFGDAQFYGSTGSLVLQRPVVGIVPTRDRGGYWLDASDGGVFSYGDTEYYGSIPGLGLHPAGSGQPHSLNAPIVGMVPSHDQGGYFMVASDGGVFAFGDAHYAGSCPGIGGCSGAAVAVMPDASGNGYWLVTSTGSVYTFGDAPYFGAPGQQSSAITSAVATPDGGGYYVLDANGQVFAYGDANGLGLSGNVPTGSTGGFNPATSIFASSDGGGYWVTDAKGDVFSFGDAPYDGGMSGTHLNGPIIAASGS